MSRRFIFESRNTYALLEAELRLERSVSNVVLNKLICSVCEVLGRRVGDLYTLQSRNFLLLISTSMVMDSKVLSVNGESSFFREYLSCDRI